MTDKTISAAIAAADLPGIGQPLADGFFVTRYWLNGVEYALIDLGAEREFTGEWGEDDQDVEGARSYRDGTANTIAMAEAESPIARKALEIGEGAFIPATLELDLLFAAKDAGEIGGFEDCWYWSSSQYSAHGAYGFEFNVGGHNTGGKHYEGRVRPVRKIPILQ
ncbi:hypothetical protein D3C76_421620 [compost metagenome]